MADITDGAGDAGADELYGTADDDTIRGLDGGDEIHGNGGFDTLYGGVGNDYLYNGVSGSGWDVATFHGEEGDDLIVSRGGLDDVAFGGTGADTFLVDGSLMDIADFEAGVDTLLLSGSENFQIVPRETGLQFYGDTTNVFLSADPSQFDSILANDVEYF